MFLITLRPCGVVEGVVASRVVPRVALEAVDVVAGWKKRKVYLCCVAKWKNVYLHCCQKKKILLYCCYIKKEENFLYMKKIFLFKIYLHCCPMKKVCLSALLSDEKSLHCCQMKKCWHSLHMKKQIIFSTLLPNEKDMFV